MDFGDWGTFSGGSWYVNGAGEKVFIDPGVTVSVEAVGTGAFKFASDGFLFAAAGPNYVPGGDEGDDDVTGDVVLKLTSGLTYTMEDVTAGNTAADGSALSGMTLWRVSVLNGADEVAEFDLGTAEGSQDLAGTYTVMCRWKGRQWLGLYSLDEGRMLLRRRGQLLLDSFRFDHQSLQQRGRYPQDQV